MWLLGRRTGAWTLISRMLEFMHLAIVSHSVYQKGCGRDRPARWLSRIDMLATKPANLSCINPFFKKKFPRKKPITLSSSGLSSNSIEQKQNPCIYLGTWRGFSPFGLLLLFLLYLRWGFPFLFLSFNHMTFIFAPLETCLFLIPIQWGRVWLYLFRLTWNSRILPALR